MHDLLATTTLLAQDVPAIFPLLCIGVVFLIQIPLLIFWVWMLVDCIKNEPSEGNDKIIWILVIVLLGVLGGAIYYFVRRPQRMRQVGK